MAEIQRTEGVWDGISAALAFADGQEQMTAAAGSDERMALLIQNGDAAKCGIYVEPGDGLRRSIGGLLVAIPNGETRVVILDSMRFKKLQGENAGKFVLHLCDPADKGKAFAGTAANVKFAQIHL